MIGLGYTWEHGEWGSSQDLTLRSLGSNWIVHRPFRDSAKRPHRHDSFMDESWGQDSASFLCSSPARHAWCSVYAHWTELCSVASLGMGQIKGVYGCLPCIVKWGTKPPNQGIKERNFLSLLFTLFLLLWATLGLHCWAWIFSSCGKQGLLTSCSAWASLVVEHRFQGAQAQDLWLTSLVPWQYVGSSWTTDWTCVSCIGRRIPNHRTTQEVPKEGCLTEKLMKLRFQDLSWARTLPRCCGYTYIHHFVMFS